MAVSICTVSGTLRDSSVSAISGATIKASYIKPFINSVDSSLVSDNIVSTLTASDGSWSLAVSQPTATNFSPAPTMVFSILYPQIGTTGLQQKDYTCTIPLSTTATFASIINPTTQA
jgi:hypothetical protein